VNGPSVLPAQGSTVQVVLRKHERQGATYPARVLLATPSRLIVAAVWTETVITEDFMFEPGDRSIEHYWLDRWYAIWQVHSPTGALKGWYCNIARPASVTGVSIVSEDLELDLWRPANGRAVRLDEDEFAARGLARDDPTAAEYARMALDELDALDPAAFTGLLEPDISALASLTPTTPRRHEPHVRGAAIVARTVTFGQVRWASPTINVADTDTRGVYFHPAGVTNKVTRGTRITTSRRDRELALRRELRDRHFDVVDHASTRSAYLVVANDGEPFASTLRTDARTGQHLPEYVNIETPRRRTQLGYDVDDLCLDVRVEPDLSWTLKDSDDLEERAAEGIYTPAQRDAVRAAAARATIAIETRAAPFDGSLRGWQPDSRWPTPSLPSNWAEHTRTAS
jgi:predicted RNA-binding protein associated with RNAse of E/G family